MAAIMAFIRIGPKSVYGSSSILNAVKFSKDIIPKQTFCLSAIQQKRIYGPEDEKDKHVEIQHWVNERYAAVALLPLIPAALAYPNFILDNLLTTAMLLHTHWRLSGVAQDYIHGEVLPKIARPTVALFSMLALGGILYFNYTDIGFANAARLLYTQL